MALLAAALQYVDDPTYNALILRRTFAQLAKADSILNKSKEWLWGKARWSSGDGKMWIFPSGSTLEFGHIEHEDSKLNYQGGAWSFVGVDEVTQFTPSMITYPRSRLRRAAGSLTPIRWRGASNPGGTSHDYIKARYVKRADGSVPRGGNRQFFPATIEDNPNIDREEYIATLKESGIDPITLAQLLEGDWDAVPGGRFRAAWLRHYAPEIGTEWLRFGEYLYTSSQLTGRFITVDSAATVKTLSKPDPDWTVISTWARTPCGYLVWIGCRLHRCEIPEIPAFVWEQYRRFGASKAYVEDNGVGKGAAQLCQRYAGGRMNVIPYATTKEKLKNAANAMCMAEAGRLWLPADNPQFPLDQVEAQLLRFTGDPKQDGHDDIVDTLSKAANVVMQGEPKKTSRRRGTAMAHPGANV